MSTPKVQILQEAVRIVAAPSDSAFTMGVVPQVSTQLSWRHDRRFPTFVGLTVGQQLALERNGGPVVTVDLGLFFRQDGS